MSVLDKQPASATVVAHTSLEGLSLDQKSFNICLSQNAQLAIAVTHTLVDRLRKANQKIASLALVSVYGRVGRYLLEKAEKNQSGKLQIRHKLSHSALAKEVGASREMVSKAMQDFKKQAFIDVLDDGTVILNERRSTPRQL
jgi:CRP-like cAMP-binding protein